MEAQKKQAFVTPSDLILNLRNYPQAPKHFQQQKFEVLRGLSLAFGYLGDILIFNESVAKHFNHLRTMFDRLRMADLKLKGKKFNFFET